jgi:hypothetical protein
LYNGKETDYNLECVILEEMEGIWALEKLRLAFVARLCPEEATSVQLRHSDVSTEPTDDEGSEDAEEETEEEEVNRLREEWIYMSDLLRRFRLLRSTFPHY